MERVEENLKGVPLSPQMRAKLAAAIALVVAISSIGMASIWLAIAEREVTPFTAIFYRLGIAAIALAFWQGIQHIRCPDRGNIFAALSTRRDAILLLVAGISFAASLVLLGWSLVRTSIANGTLLYNNVPIFTALFAWLVLKQTFSLKFILGMGVALAGVVAIAIGDWQVSEFDITGDAAALFASTLAATSLLCFEKLREKLTAGLTMMWVSLVGSVVLLPLVWLQGGNWLPTEPDTWIALCGLALVSQALGQGLLTYFGRVFGWISVGLHVTHSRHCSGSLCVAVRRATRAC